MPFTYQSGREIKKGDRVLYFDEPGEIEFVADPLDQDDETTWFVEEHGGGLMIIEPKHFGHVFIGRPKEGLRFDIRVQARLNLAKVDPAFCLA